MRRVVVVIILLVLLLGGLFFFNGQADPLPQEMIETPVTAGDEADGDA